MAQIIFGKSTCVLCSKVLEKSDKIQSFAAFLPFDHKFGKFSDAVMHEQCYEADPDHDMVEDMYAAYRMIWDSRPRDLKTVEEIDNWHKDAFQDWPPKNGVVIFHPLSEDSEEGSFYMDADQYEDMCKMEAEHEAAEKERQKYRHQRDAEESYFASLGRKDYD